MEGKTAIKLLEILPLPLSSQQIHQAFCSEDKMEYRPWWLWADCAAESSYYRGKGFLICILQDTGFFSYSTLVMLPPTGE